MSTGARHAAPSARSWPRSAATAPNLFETQVGHRPTALAVVSSSAEYSYRELNERANRLARLLVSHGIGPEDVVAVALPRSIGLLVALYAVLKAGAAYLPLDPGYPADRVSAILADARPVFVITDQAFGLSIGRSGAVPGLVLLVLDAPQTRDALAASPASDLTDADRRGALRPENSAYVIYTSGSTGRPKGVVVSHRALSGYLRWCQEAYPGLRGGAILHSSVSFDLTVTTLFAPLAVGGTVYLSDLIDLDSSLWRDGRPVPTFLKVTPSHLPLLDSLPRDALPEGELVVGGEQLRGETLARYRSRHPRTTVVNEYGPTEAAVGCVTYRVPPGEADLAGAVPIGVPAENTRAYVLDDRLDPVAAGAPGELYIASDQLARGYLGQPALSATRFVADPLGPAGSRMYRTGDLVRRMPDGNLEFLGRTDDQVKIRSHRIEPAEVEVELSGAPGVDQICVIAAEGPDGLRLIAYVTPQTGIRAPEVDVLREYAENRLPHYMLPAEFVLLDQLPLTVNGKVDRRALPPPEPVTATASAVTARPMNGTGPATETERVLTKICSELLGLEAVAVTENFFTLGGDSILSIRFAARARRAGFVLTPMDVFRSQTIRALAAAADGPTASPKH